MGATLDPEEKERLKALRKEMLDTRDRLDEEAHAVFEARAGLLRDMLTADDPKEMARRHLNEIDEPFLSILSANLEDAHKRNDQHALEALRDVWNAVMSLMEEAMPPELRLINRLMGADEEEIDRLLEESRNLVTEPMAQFAEETEARAREEGDTETADQMARVAEKMRGMLARDMLA